MKVVVISQNDVKKILSMKECIELVAEAHGKLAQGHAIQPLRQEMFTSNRKGVIATMPAFIGGENSVLGLKNVSVFHDNVKIGIGTVSSIQQEI